MALGAVILALALIFLACSISYLVGAYRAATDLDENYEIAKALGAYGALLRIEAAALGISVQALIDRDARAGHTWDGTK